MLNAGPDGKYLTGDEPAAFPKQLARNVAGKLSYQMTPRYQLSGYFTKDKNFNEADLQIAPFGAAVDFTHSPWEQTNPFDWKPYVYKSEFRGTPSNTTFFDVQYGKSGYKLYYGIQDEAVGKPTMYDRSTLLLTVTASHISDTTGSSVERRIVPPASSAASASNLDITSSVATTRARVRESGQVTTRCCSTPRRAAKFRSAAPVDQPTGMTSIRYGTDRWRLGDRVTLNLSRALG